MTSRGAVRRAHWTEVAITRRVPGYASRSFDQQNLEQHDMRISVTLTALAVAGLTLSACVPDSYYRDEKAHAPQGANIPVNACMAAVKRRYGRSVRNLWVSNSENSLAGSVVIVEANGERWRCLASNEGRVEDLRLMR